MSDVFNEIKEALTMRKVAEHFGYSVNRSGFILSPFSREKTASCKLYRNSYFDFSSNSGGDLIRFSALVLGRNNWEACQYLVQAFSLPISLSGAANHREEIEQRQRKQRKKKERQQAFKAALSGEIDALKQWTGIYATALNRGMFEPFSDLWCYCINNQQKAIHKLDILCATDLESYRRMKPDVAMGLPSGRPQWLLDTLAILAENGAFLATESELKEIKKQVEFELCGRKPGEDRRRAIEW